MIEGKYIIAVADNSLNIAIRNILNSTGYEFMGNCGDSVSFLRLARNLSSDFAVIDLSANIGNIRRTVEIIDAEMLCSCIILTQRKDMDIIDMLDKTRIVTYCPKPLNRDILLHTVEISMMNYKRVSELDKKLKEMTENFEVRKVVERAKWILMEKDNINENEAYRRLREKSMNNRMPIKNIAQAIIFANDLADK